MSQYGEHFKNKKPGAWLDTRRIVVGIASVIGLMALMAILPDGGVLLGLTMLAVGVAGIMVVCDSRSTYQSVGICIAYAWSGVDLRAWRDVVYPTDQLLVCMWSALLVATMVVILARLHSQDVALAFGLMPRGRTQTPKSS